jgi:hypothetical protein
MAAPTYFLPGVKRDQVKTGETWNRETLTTHHLAKTFSDVHDFDHAAAHELIGAGPGGASGCIVCVWNGSPPQRAIRYLPDHQDWAPILDGSKLWIGLDLIEPVKPSDISRRTTTDGHKVTLSDGGQWLIPVYRDPFGGTKLPQDVFYDQSGDVRVEVKREHIERWETCGKLWDILTAATEDDMPIGWALDYCTDALSVNYRFDRHLQTRTRLIDKQNMGDICQATVDWPLVLEMLEAQKKSEGPLADAMPNSMPGPPVADLATSQAAAS